LRGVFSRDGSALVLVVLAPAWTTAFVRSHLGVHRLHARLHLRMARFTVAMLTTHGAAFRRRGLGRLVAGLREQRGGREGSGGQGCGYQQLLHHHLLAFGLRIKGDSNRAMPFPPLRRTLIQIKCRAGLRQSL
jgi:hypothetical protein